MRQGRDQREKPFWEAVLDGDAAGPGYDRLRDVLAWASRLYGAGLDVYLGAETWRLRTRKRLPVPVLSIGNLSVGGTGKTPMTQYLVRALISDGWHPAILSRGYRGALHGRNLAVSNRAGEILLSSETAGDEPYLLANSLLGVPVIVGKDRYVSGRLAIDAFRSNVVLLDDGFQYWQLARDLDIVLLDARHPFGNGHALPRGLLREPKRNLARAGLIVVSRAQGMTQAERETLLRDITTLAPQTPVFWARHVPGDWKPLNAAAESRPPERAMSLCGIAQPGSFLKSVRESGVEIMGEPMIYSDHHRYGPPEMRVILGKIKDYNATALVTTEKDAAKLNIDLLPIPAYALEIRVEIEDGAAFRTRVSEVLVRSYSRR